MAHIVVHESSYYSILPIVLGISMVIHQLYQGISSRPQYSVCPPCMLYVTVPGERGRRGGTEGGGFVAAVRQVKKTSQNMHIVLSPFVFNVSSFFPYKTIYDNHQALTQFIVALFMPYGTRHLGQHQFMQWAWQVPKHYMSWWWFQFVNWAFRNKF